MANRTVSVAIKAEVAGFISNVNAAGKTVQGFNGELTRLGKDSPHKLNEVSNAAGAMGLALVAGFGYAVKAAMDFDKQMSEVGAVSGATAGDMGKLRDAALEAGKATQYSATEAAKAEAELAKAGISTAQILGGALTGSLSLAAAGGLDLAEAAEIAAKTMNIFGLAGKDVGHIADVLASAANKSATDVHEMGEALKMGGLLAHSAGWSLEETSGVLALFADHALAGSDGGTSMKTMLQALMNPSIKASAVMHDLGISVYDANGNFLKATDLAGMLQRKLGTLSNEQRNAAMATIFGSDAVRAANILYQAGTDVTGDYIRSVDDVGAAQDVARKKTDNLAGDLERLKGSVETLAIEAGSGANGGLRTLTQTANGLVDSFAALPSGVQSTVTVLAGLGGASLLAMAGFVKIRQNGTQALEALAGMGPAGEKAATGIGKAASAAGKFAGAAAGVVVGAELISAAWRAFVDQPKETSLSDLSKGMIEFGKTGKAGAGTIDLFGSKLERLDRDLAALNNNMPDNFAHRVSAFVEGFGAGDIDGTFTKAKANINEMDTALAALAQGGHAEEAAAAFDKIAAEAKKSGVNITELKDGFPLYQAALDGATNTQLKAIEVNERNATSTDLLKGSLEGAIDALGGFKAAYDAINGAAISFAEAEIGAEKATTAFKKAIDDSNGSLDIHNEKGMKAKETLLAASKAAAEAAQKKYDETGSVEAATNTYNGYIAQLRKAMIDAGMNKQAVDALINTYAAMPPLVSTKIIQDFIVRRTEIINRTGMEPGRGNSRLAPAADGAVMRFYDSGGVERHVAQIQPAGAWRVWAEPETGGESYIPHALSKRARSTAILAETNKILGYPLGGKPAQRVGPYASVLAAGGNQPGPAAMHVVVQVQGAVEIEGTGVMAGIRKQVRIQGGSVQQVLGTGGR